MLNRLKGYVEEGAEQRKRADAPHLNTNRGSGTENGRSVYHGMSIGNVIKRSEDDL